MTQFTILLSGEIVATDRLKAQVRGTRVIAADSGIRHCAPLALEPELWVGDFDSSDDFLRQRYETIEHQKWPIEKDLTDGEIAINAALEKGATSLILVGAHGGRLDYQMQHLVLAAHLPCPCMLSDGKTEAHSLTVVATPDWPPGAVFSILAISDLKGVSISGCRWPLSDVDVAAGSGWTMSNEVADTLQAEIKAGKALLIAEV